MTYVISGLCATEKDASCVTVCPVDCIHPKPGEGEHEDADQLYINAAECIDCGACEAVCPVSAIFALEELPAEWAVSATLADAHYGVAR